MNKYFIELEGTIKGKTTEGMYLVSLDVGFMSMGHFYRGINETFFEFVPGDRVLVRVINFKYDRCKILKKVSMENLIKVRKL